MATLLQSEPVRNGGVSESRGRRPRLSHRDRLLRRFERRIRVNEDLNRSLVSWQSNRGEPGFRWFRFKEGFSSELVRYLLQLVRVPGRLLDPFAGTGVAPIVGAKMGWHSTGVEILPVAVHVSRAVAAAHAVNLQEFHELSIELLETVDNANPAHGNGVFPHLRITDHAFSEENECQIVAARDWLHNLPDSDEKTLVSLAAMSALEDASWTSKDGQYLRWDHRSGRELRATVEKRNVLPYAQSLRAKLQEVADDIPVVAQQELVAPANFVEGSCFQSLAEMEDNSCNVVVTSPPYANRYDYTRTYALELAWLGYDDTGISDLRQRLLSATVENRSKREQLTHLDPDSLAVYDTQPAIREVVRALRSAKDRGELPNPNVVRLVENYCMEMAFVVAQLGRVCSQGASVFMVNDNVQYGGEELPVDLILSDIAWQCGFRTKAIWKLPRGKGNSSQQMGRYGRREIRKCVYWWVRR